MTVREQLAVVEEIRKANEAHAEAFRNGTDKSKEVPQ